MERDNDKPKVTVIPGGSNPNEVKEALRNIRSNLQLHLEYIQITAKMHKTKYDALIKEGFTDAQALELCKKLFDLY